MRIVCVEVTWVGHSGLGKGASPAGARSYKDFLAPGWGADRDVWLSWGVGGARGGHEMCWLLFVWGDELGDQKCFDVLEGIETRLYSIERGRDEGRAEGRVVPSGFGVGLGVRITASVGRYVRKVAVVGIFGGGEGGYVGG